MALFGSSGNRRIDSKALATGAAHATGDSDVIAVNERNFEREILRSDVPVLIEFSATWCEPCKTVAPVLHAFAREMRGKAKVVTIDVDEFPSVPQQLGIKSIPTFASFAGGQFREAAVGVIPKTKMAAMLQPHLPRAAGALKPQELAQLLREGSAVAIDTRDAGAYGRTRLPGAKHFPLEEVEQRLAEVHMVEGTPVLYCRGGDKTKELAAKLNEQGVPLAYLEGGLLAWEAENLPVER